MDIIELCMNKWANVNFLKSTSGLGHTKTVWELTCNECKQQFLTRNFTWFTIRERVLQANHTQQHKNMDIQEICGQIIKHFYSSQSYQQRYNFLIPSISNLGTRRASGPESQDSNFELFWYNEISFPNHSSMFYYVF